MAGTDFEESYAEIAPALYSWCCLRMRPTLRAQLQPEDLMQDVWLRAIKNANSFDPSTGAFRPWIFGIAKRALLEAAHRSRRPADGADGGSAARQALEQVPASVTSIGSRVARDEALAELLARVEHLSDEDKRILVRCGLEGRTCKDTAERLGISEHAVAKRWQRLRAEIRERGWARLIE